MDAGQLVRESACGQLVLGVLCNARADRLQALRCQIMTLSSGWEGGDLVPNVVLSGSVTVFAPLGPRLHAVSVFIIMMA